jgi:hypothetical protein
MVVPFFAEWFATNTFKLTGEGRLLPNRQKDKFKHIDVPALILPALPDCKIVCFAKKFSYLL